MLQTCTRWCLDGDTYHIKICGPRCSGKTSVVRYMMNKDATFNEQIKPTQGMEISLVRVGHSSLLLYDSDNHEEDDYANAKWLNLKANAVGTREPDALVFIIDGTDRGRLALASKMLNDLVERSNRAQVLLVLITKADAMDRSDVSTTDNGISPRRLADLFCNQSPAKAAHTPMSKQESLGAEVHTPSEGLARHNGTSPLCKPTVSKNNGCTLTQVTALMTHPSLLQKKWCAFYCSAVNGSGISEGFDWLVDSLEKKTV